MKSVKQAAVELIQKLPEDCTWDDVVYRVYVRQKIEAGLKDADEGRFVSEEEMERVFDEMERGFSDADHLDGRGAGGPASDPRLHRP